MPRGVRIQVIGKVQGVWFRASTKSVAEQLQVKGSVRNLDDGSVEIIAFGTEGAVDALISWCASGPELARVEDVRVTDIPADTGIPDSFSVVRSGR